MFSMILGSAKGNLVSNNSNHMGSSFEVKQVIALLPYLWIKALWCC